MVREITHKRSFTTWLWLMLDRAPVFITTFLPMLLCIIGYVLNGLGLIHAAPGWQTTALSVALFAGRALREGLTNGKIVAGLNKAKAEYQDFLNQSHMAEPVGPYAPAGNVVVTTGGYELRPEPPGVPAPNAPLAGGAEGASVRGY